VCAVCRRGMVWNTGRRHGPSSTPVTESARADVDVQVAAVPRGNRQQHRAGGQECHLHEYLLLAVGLFDQGHRRPAVPAGPATTSAAVPYSLYDTEGGPPRPHRRLHHRRPPRKPASRSTWSSRAVRSGRRRDEGTPDRVATSASLKIGLPRSTCGSKPTSAPPGQGRLGGRRSPGFTARQ